MNKKYLRICLLGVTLLPAFCLLAQINPDRISIARDQWGVPHIFAPTDREVAYGLAWATAEDDFKTMQELLLPVRGLSGQVFGRSGAEADVGVHLMDLDNLVGDRYEGDLSPEFRDYLEAYVAGVNAYARAHPKEVLHKKLFPVTGQDVIKGYIVGMALLSGVHRDISRIMGGKLETDKLPSGEGSNAIAVSARKTTDGKTYLAINSHQPLEGLNSWYEAHLCSDEGLNILGATFAGGVTIFLGANEYLGWGHTVNHPDFADIYQLTMHPKKKNMYRFDGQWEKLEPFHTKARLKVLG
ncbi:MAG: acylase, partial [Bacteroidetes bacterium]